MFGLPIPIALGKPLAYLLAAIALVLFGRGWGQHSMFKEWMAANEAARIQAVKIIQRQDRVSERVRIEYRDRLVQLDGVNTTIEKEVTRYVESKPLVMACLLDARWLQLHNAAAAGAVPPPAGGADDPGAGIAAPAALPTVTGNYATYHAVAARLSALQRWVREQYQATNGEALEAVEGPAKPP